ncbi:hypothetical protein L9F63_016539, partial [Diploptera punctata]
AYLLYRTSKPLSCSMPKLPPKTEQVLHCNHRPAFGQNYYGWIYIYIYIYIHTPG